jgi:hypothetical protein
MKKLLLLIFIVLPTICLSVEIQWEPRGVGGGGALFAPSINPDNDDEFYVGCDMGELFHTTDFGNSYETLNFNYISGGTNSIVGFTKNSQIRFSLDYAGDSITPVKSIDGGMLWNEYFGNSQTGNRAFSIWVDHKSNNRIIVSYWSEIYFINEDESTSMIHKALDNGAGIIIAGVFFDNENIYIGTNDGLLVSKDSGATFNLEDIPGIPSGEHIWSFAAAKQNGITRFFCITATDIYAGKQGYEYYNVIKGVYSLDYGSGQWVSKLNGIDINKDFLMYVGMAENDISTAYLCGSSSESKPNVMKTTNAGSNWFHVFNTTNNQNISTGWSGDCGDRAWTYGECALGFAVAPNNANKLIFTDLGFVHKSSDGGATWEQAYLPKNEQNPAGSKTPSGKSYHSIGLENTTCHQIFWVDEKNIFAGFSDIKGIRSTDGGETWSFNYTGHDANTMYRLLKHQNGNLYAATSNIHDMYQSTRLTDAILDKNDPGGKIISSTDKGAKWQDIHNFGHPVYWLTLDPNDPNTMYASVIHHTDGGIFYTHNLQDGAGSKWSKLPNPPRTEGHPATIAVLKTGEVLCTYSGRRAPNFTASSGVFLYDTTSASWYDLSDKSMKYWTKDLVIDPNDPKENTWYVGVFSGWGGAANGLGGLYKTTNQGATWGKINNLDRVTSITFNPNNKEEVYMTTEERGLWFCPHFNTEQPVFFSVTSYPFKQPERVFFNPYDTSVVWVASFGNGMKVGKIIYTDVKNKKEKPQQPTLTISPNPINSMLNITYILCEKSRAIIKIYDLFGNEIAKLIDEELVEGKYNNQLSIINNQLPDGVYYMKLETNGTVKTVPFVIIR